MTPRVPRPLAFAESVLGVGLLLLPPVALAGTGGGGDTWTAWALLGVFALCWCTALGLAGGSRAGAAALAGDRFGPPAGAAVTAMYLVGFLIGQAAIALAAGRFATAAYGAASWAPYAAGAAVLAAAALLAARGVAPGTAARRVRLAAVVVLTAGFWTWPGLLRGEVFDGAGQGALPLAFLLLFALVGMETAVPAAGARGRRRGLVPAVGGGVLIVSAGYLLALRPWVRDADPQPPPDAVAAVWGAAAAAVCLTYCLTNLRAAARFLDTLLATARPGRARPAEPARVALCVGLCLTVLGAAAAGSWGVGALLAGPAAMTWAIYTLVLAVATLPPAGVGPEALGALAALLVMTVAAGAALLLPLAVAGAAGWWVWTGRRAGMRG
ncbi:hypothetical protein [Streptomyces sp. SAJ15]|uniref:hypothetical protein n=1 Tax=Streptomyces sp. SAJ15 TaxID=2011095 RepID=UPI001185A49F|nr:hypothetical protein [Streptomyces sp. SAJ15]TVL93006.1 hypothetical protein CD790_07700 [Streptomyces sp. SAJ15]